MKKYSTAESVCLGHPDKLCDYIADSILDECLKLDKSSRVACEVMATKGTIIVAGEITCSKRVWIRSIVNRALRDVGYNPLRFIIYNFTHRQSKDISAGVSKALEARNGDNTPFSNLGAGDQGTVYGYANDETDDLLPLPLILSHKICKRLDYVRKYHLLPDILPDGKAQVTVEYEDGKPRRIKTIVVSVQHKADKNLKDLEEEIIAQVLHPALASFPFDDKTEILINPSGRFVEGGPSADTGLTGRKLMVDTYGGLALHGGGAFSGKDPTKVDRSGAYMARYIAKNLVFAGLASECQVSISYAIGKADPVAVSVNAFGTGRIDDSTLADIVCETFNMRPAAIIEQFHLRSQCYTEFSAYGHFGQHYPEWERTDKFIQLSRMVDKYVN